MEIIDYNKIHNLVVKGEINFIAFIMTPWHLIGTKAAIQYLKQEGITVKPIIISLPHPETGFAVTQDDDFSIYQLSYGVGKPQIQVERNCILRMHGMENLREYFGFFRIIGKILMSSFLKKELAHM